MRPHRLVGDIDTQAEFAEEIAKEVPVGEFDWRSAIARSLGLRVAGDRAGDNQ